MSDEPRLPRPDVAHVYARVREIDETLVLAAEDQMVPILLELARVRACE